MTFSYEYDIKYCDLDCPIQKGEIAHCSKTGVLLEWTGNEYFGRVTGCNKMPVKPKELEIEVAEVVEVAEVKKEEPLTLF